MAGPVARAPAGSRERDRVARARLASQRLVGRPFRSAAEVVGWFGAVQSQDYLGAKWAVAQRTLGLTSAGFDPLLADGTIVRTHVLRPTWHFVLRDDIRWMLELTAPRVQAVSAPYYRRLELSPAMRRRSADAMARALVGGNRLTRPELTRVIQSAGVPTDGLRLGFILGNAELERVICSGGLRGKQQTYALFDEQVPAARPLAREEAVARLVLRYFVSHGPATAHDFAWWSGLTVGDARKGIAAAGSDLAEASIAGQAHWTAAETPRPRQKGPVVRLLSNYDEFAVAYRDHGLTLDRSRFEREAPADAFAAHLVMLDGWVVGGWKRTVTAKRAAVAAQLFVPLDAQVRAALESECSRFGDFLGVPADLAVAT